jgi:DNA-binding CsgD family transcriptional regulator
VIGMLVDRVVEVDALESLLAAVDDRLSGVLVLRGEPGAGKTALLDHAVRQAGDMQVVRVTGVESEMDLGFAALHQLLFPLLDGLDDLPPPQREALGSAFGLVAGPAPGRFLVGLAALTLLTDTAEDRPVLCVIDDAQWVDRVSVEVLGFVARRLYADRVGMLFAVREGEQAGPLEGLSELTVGALPDEAAAELLAAVASGPLDRRTCARIVAEAAGNPLALVEFLGELAEADPLDDMSPGRPLRSGRRMEKQYVSRVRALPAEAQLLLLVVAADQLGEPGTIWRAARELGIGPEVAALPEVERLVTWEPRVQFRHPLIRSAAYYAASTVTRRRAHAALAAASDPEGDPDRRAWHLAAASPRPDEQVAAELERSADRARGRGGWASGAVFLERSAELTPDRARAAQRRLAAAEARLVAGDVGTARMLVERAAPHLADPLARAMARRLEGLILNAAGQVRAATSVLLDAAQMIEPFDPRLARDTRLDGFVAAVRSSSSAAMMGEVLRAIHSAPTVGDPQATVAELLLDGFTALAERRYQDGAALLQRVISPLASGQPIPDDALPHFVAISLAASALYDDSARHHLAVQWVAELRDRGALAALLVALVFLMSVQIEEGRLAEAEATVAEGRALSKATGYRVHLDSFSWMELRALAWRGQVAEARPLAARLLREFTEQGHANAVAAVDQALAILDVGLGNYADALSHARVARTGRRAVLGLGPVAETVEAGTRCGEREAAAAALEAFTPWALANGTDWALGLLARCRALLAADEDAEPEYLLAIEHLRRCRLAPELARAHLLYGEWLRRQRRRRDARDQLHTASEMFDTMGMQAFADRAWAELRATGERARRRSPETQDLLTPQEAQIARLAAEGAANSEIAARLFISASTVDYHLRKVFRKLGVTSRVQLARALLQPAEAPGPEN